MIFGHYVKRIHKRCYGQTTPDTYFLTDPYVGHGPSMEIKEIMSTLTLVVNSLEERIALLCERIRLKQTAGPRSEISSFRRHTVPQMSCVTAFQSWASCSATLCYSVLVDLVTR